MTAPAAARSPKPRTAALYTRVSTIEQGERYSIPSQIEKLQAKAAAEGCTVPPEWIFIDTHTGKETSRPKFEKLRALVKSGGPQAVFVLGVDRFARKVHDAALVSAEFKRHGCKLDFVEMRNDDSPEGRLQFNIMASMAEYMGEKIVEKGKDGRARMVNAGRIPGGVPVFGHDAHPAEKGKRIVNEREAKIVYEIFELAAHGMPPYAIAVYMNERGVRSKGCNGRPPAPWSRTTIKQLLTNRAYIGQHQAKDVILDVPRIVPDELFFRVQAQLEKAGKRWVGRPSDKFLLRNFGFCGVCNHRLIGKSKGSRSLAYVCGHRSNKPPIKQLCPAPRVKAALLETVVWRAIWQLLTTPALLRSQAEAYYDALPKPDTSNEDTKRAQLAKLQRQRANRRKMYESGDEDYTDDARAEMRDIKRQIATLEAELNAIAPVLTLPAEHVIAGCLREITEGDEPTTYPRRRDILEGILDLRTTYADGHVTVTGRVPLNESATGSSTFEGENSHRSLSDDSNSHPSIPFILKLKVA